MENLEGFQFPADVQEIQRILNCALWKICRLCRLVNKSRALCNSAISACSEEQQVNFICGPGADHLCNPM